MTSNDPEPIPATRHADGFNLDPSRITAISRRPVLYRRSNEGETPTPWMLTLDDGLTRRVYVLSYGNGGGTPYVKVAGIPHYLPPSVESQLDAHADELAHQEQARDFDYYLN